MNKNIIIAGLAGVVLVGGVLVVLSSESDAPSVTNESSQTAPAEQTSSAQDDFKEIAEGVKIKDDQVGDGAEVADSKVVTIDYVLKDEAGKTYKDTKSDGAPEKFVVGFGKEIEGLEKGLSGMKVGGKRSIIVSPAQGYGKTGSKSLGIPGDTTIVYEVELKNVEDEASE